MILKELEGNIYNYIKYEELNKAETYQAIEAKEIFSNADRKARHRTNLGNLKKML